MCKLQIRSFTRADQRAAKDLIILGLGEHFTDTDPSLNPDIDDIHSQYLQRGHSFIVAQLKSRIVATAGLVNINNSQAKIVRMSVAKECRRQGIARNLLEYVIKLAL